MTGLLIEPEAEIELEQTATYYEDASTGLGLDFLAEMRQRTFQIVEAPHRYPPFGSVAGVQCVAIATSRAWGTSPCVSSRRSSCASLK